MLRCNAFKCAIAQLRAATPPIWLTDAVARRLHSTNVQPCQLGAGEKGTGASNKPLHYKGSKFHRVIPDFMLQVRRSDHPFGYHMLTLYVRENLAGKTWQSAGW